MRPKRFCCLRPSQWVMCRHACHFVSLTLFDPVTDLELKIRDTAALLLPLLVVPQKLLPTYVTNMFVCDARMRVFECACAFVCVSSCVLPLSSQGAHGLV